MALAWTYGLVSGVLAALLAVSGLCYALSLRYRPYLRSIPGPFLASFTDLWRLLAVDKGNFEVVLQVLHNKYGDLVRVGPNCISVGDPREIKQIYGITRLYQKVSSIALSPGTFKQGRVLPGGRSQVLVRLLQGGATSRQWQACCIALYDHRRRPPQGRETPNS